MRYYQHYYLIWFFENHIILLNIIMMKLCMQILMKINYENKYLAAKFYRHIWLF